MSTAGIESARPGSIPRGERSARVELFALGQRLAAANDPEVTLLSLMEDVRASYGRMLDDLNCEPKGASDGSGTD